MSLRVVPVSYREAADFVRTVHRHQSLWREAAKTHHPDAGGDPVLFRQLTEARDLLIRERNR